MLAIGETLTATPDFCTGNGDGTDYPEGTSDKGLETLVWPLFGDLRTVTVVVKWTGTVTMPGEP